MLDNLSNEYVKWFLHDSTDFLACAHTVGENIIATTKIRNNYGAIQLFIFPIFG